MTTKTNNNSFATTTTTNHKGNDGTSFDLTSSMSLIDEFNKFDSMSLSLI